ncbi:uncharacterized protein LOC133373818 [Rhineura floridana]|uniref:uncharacterized protein LOC133373818 n=1 Tax=Rhineura floridana TaxID=261503 RepID=UPI002AC88C8D|nr:uncharacterized protein LOC133373818 [Rhineura floridana]XP_061460063.1 uncharacterized protein LOC133373818 [Rhineura floridana]XP_061460065.1 uncharacterized protein LOC133373818 [Rhineura floridana]
MSYLWNKSYMVAALSIILFTSVIIHSYLYKGETSPVPMFCSRKHANGTITPLKDNRTFIVAAYHDNRQNGMKMTRVIGIVHHHDTKGLYCWFCCPVIDGLYVSQAEIDVHRDRFDFPYGTGDLSCLEPENCEPRYVMLHRSPKSNIHQLPWFEIRNRDVGDSRVDFTVCISTMFGEYNNVLQFVQAVEMYKILGAGKVVIYKNSCSKLMAKVLDVYAAEGIAEIISWPINSYLNVSSHWHHSKDHTKDLGYYGQVTTLNDCIYRNMYTSKYLLLNVVDEVILPVRYPDWGTMMKALQKKSPEAGVFLFENHIFPKTVFTPTDPFNISSWDAVPGVNMLQHVMREPDRKHIFNPRKMIVDPRRVVQTSVHSVLKAYGESIFIPMDVAYVYHCRAPLQEKLPRESLIKDTTLWRYNKSLVTNVNRVLQQVTLET